MTADLEHDLREALFREAARAPQPPDRWTPRAPIVQESPDRSHRVLLLAACLIVVAGIAGLIATQRDAAPTNGNDFNSTPDSINRPDDAEATPTTRPVVVAPGSGDPVPTTVVESPPIVGGAAIAVGSSRMLGAAPELQRLGFMINAVESRQFADAVAIVQDLAERRDLPDVVVIDLGDNGSIQTSDIDVLMAQLRDVPTVVMVTTPIDRDWAAPNNALIAVLPATFPNVTVLDFATEATQCPGECYYADNLHLRPDGRRFYANLIADAAGLDQLPPTSTPEGTPSVDDSVLVDIDAAASMIPPIPIPAHVDGPNIQIANGDIYRTTASGDSLCVSRSDSDGGGASACGNPTETGGLLLFTTPPDNDIVTTFVLTAAATELSFVPEVCASTWTSSTADLVLRACQANSDSVAVDFRLTNDPAPYRFEVVTRSIDRADESD